MAEKWWSSWTVSVVPYAVLLRRFIDRDLDADEFELLFLHLYKNDNTNWPRDLFDVLDTLFAEVDDYCEDEELRSRAGGIDAQQLHHSAAVALARLRDLAGPAQE